MTKPMWQGLGEAISKLPGKDAIRCTSVRGAGEKSFSPGNGIAEFQKQRSNKAQAIEYGHIMRAPAAAFIGCQHPIVAQIHGICVGGRPPIFVCPPDSHGQSP